MKEERERVRKKDQTRRLKQEKNHAIKNKYLCRSFILSTTVNRKVETQTKNHRIKE